MLVKVTVESTLNWPGVLHTASRLSNGNLTNDTLYQESINLTKRVKERLTPHVNNPEDAGHIMYVYEKSWGKKSFSIASPSLSVCCVCSTSSVKAVFEDCDIAGSQRSLYSNLTSMNEPRECFMKGYGRLT